MTKTQLHPEQTAQPPCPDRDRWERCTTVLRTQLQRMAGATAVCLVLRGGDSASRLKFIRGRGITSATLERL